jgi:hypothetical protein
MKNLPHGIISIILAGIAMFIGFLAIYNTNQQMAFIFLIILILGFTIIAYSYCSKCALRNNCAHVVVGKITNLLPQRKQTNYTFWDFIGVIVPFFLILAIPQIYLIKNIWMLVTFWGLFLLAYLEINKFVCTKCLNSKCPMCKNRCIKNEIN